MFSIIVPSYNRKEEIPALLESLTKQTTYNFDVVIVDDCSKEPVEVTQSYPFAVKVIRNETNQGAAESRNIGARNADNDWLLFLDDDDRFAMINVKNWRILLPIMLILTLFIILQNVKW